MSGQARAMMLFADAKGRIFDHPELEMLGWDGECWRPPADDELVPLPEGSDLFMLPGRRPAGLDAGADEVVVIDEPGVLAASCFIAPAYVRVLLPAYETLVDAPALSLFGYSAVGIRDGELVTSCFRVDPDIRQDPYRFDVAEVEAGVGRLRGADPDNRLVEHLSHCALEYHCRAAQNFFLERFEAPLPTAPTCNAFCVGCLSFQPAGGDEQYSAPHARIGFVPTPDEIARVALGHIERVGDEAVVSFGQGCEGEPLLQGDTLLAAVREIRASTGRGVVNLNSNSSRPKVVARLREAGLDSLRVSTNSARPELYEAYFRPVGYGFEQVRETARAMAEAGGFLMLNYFVFPGVTDTEPELEALSRWIDEDGVHMLQLRNLNVDPEVYLKLVVDHGLSAPPMGILAWVEELKRRHPALRLGYFNPPRSVVGDRSAEALP